MSAITLTKSPVSTTLAATAPLGSWVSALKVAGVGIGTRVPVPVLAGAKISVTDGVVLVSGFDYETFATARVYGGAGNDGAVLVMHKLLLDMLVTAGKRATKRVSDAWPVSIGTAENGMVLVVVNGTTFTLAQLPLENYPTLPAIDAGCIKVDAGALIRAFDTAMVSVSKDDTLPILTGIRMEVSHGTLTLLSTDRYRLTLAELPVEGAGEYTGLLRAKTWKGIKRVLNAKGGLVTIGFENEERWITFNQDELSIGSLMIDGDYPKIRSLFPDSPEIIFELDADLLASMVATVSVTAERNTPVRLTYNGIDSLRIDAGTGEDAQAEAFMPYTAPRGNRGFAVAYNPHYLAEALKDLKGQTIHMLHTTAPKPVCIVGADSDSVKHLVMPVRLPNK